MNTISGFWHAAARLSGRIDWSTALRSHNGSLSFMSRENMTQAGIGIIQQNKLLRGSALTLTGDAILIEEPTYPPPLRLLPFAPAVLFCKGNLDLLAEVSVAVVGARRCTQRAKAFTKALASSLAESGLVIVSGLAYGIDEAAHHACLGRTIAVLGQGIETALRGPKRKHIEAILSAGGLVVSEFPPYQRATRYTFPQRNRVIAGLSIGTVVIEAGMRSGSRITARHALEFGREVMAVPGHPFDAHSAGCNHLIRDGALLIQDANDVRRALGFDPSSNPKASPESAIAKQIIDALETGLTIDELLEKTRLPMPTLLMSIDSLELTGWVQRLPGDRICVRNDS